ncbi:hypothetical protein MMC27_001975 [Xylographa pallens]|nr:hypothetical protein [Xylographa pallens]
MGRLEHTSTVGGERVDATDHCRSGIARLHKEVQDASSYVPAYDQRIYGQAIKALNEKLDETKASFAPKSRFTFKTAHKNPSAISLSDAAELASEQQAKVPGFSPSDASGNFSIATTPTSLEPLPNETSTRPPEPPRKDSLGTFLVNAGVKATIKSEPALQDPHLAKVCKPSFASSNSVNISSHVGLHIILPSTAAHATTSASLTNLCRCIVDMSIPTAEGQPFAGLTVKNIKQSLLVCGSVSGAAHMTGVDGTVIVVATHQFRMHECTNCVVYLHVNSRPVIEDCHGIQFAPIPPQYTKPHPNMNNLNQWDQVQDFKWLKAQPSPNWSKLPTKDMVPKEVWNKLVADTHGLSLDDILKAGGVTRLKT